MTEIERLEPADWERSRAIRLRALADNPDAFGRTLEEERSLAIEAWRRRLEDGAAATFAAVKGGADVGLVVGAPWSGREGTAGLFAMWVAPEARRTGVGDLLVRTVIDWARGQGYRRLRLDVGDENGPAIGLYERNGFEPTGATGTLPPPRTHIREHQRERAL